LGGIEENDGDGEDDGEGGVGEGGKGEEDGEGWEGTESREGEGEEVARGSGLQPMRSAMVKMKPKIKIKCSLLQISSAVKETGIEFFLQKSSTKAAFSIILNGILGFALYFLILSGCLNRK
jgi:hypothetical protein